MRNLLLFILLLCLTSCGHTYQPPGQDIWRAL